MSPILLDRTGDADLPTGYTLVTTERAFLTAAVQESQLMVRGNALCDWAAGFYQGREISVQETESPLVFLHDLVPALSREHATMLLARIRPHLYTLTRPWRLPALLQLLYPNVLWDEPPSPAHAAAWLLWLHQNQPSREDAPLRAALAAQWQQEAAGPEAALYAVDTHAAATTALLTWLDVEADNTYATLRPFPGELPPSLLDESRRRWKKALAQSHGQALPELLARPLVKALRLALVQVAHEHFSRQAKHLTSALFAQLAPSLTTTQQDKLRKLLPPPPPPALPSAPAAVATWFRDHYLPYRLWQVRHGDEHAAGHVHMLLHDFAAWYLTNYRSALAGGPLAPFLAFNRMAALHQKQDTSLTLVVVLDGLHLADAQQLLRALDEGTDRLTFVSYDLAFAPLPTVTEFCKDSLFRGVPPLHIPKVSPMGEIVADMAFPVAKLDAAKPGQIVFWRVMEPDATYHERNTAAKLYHEIDAALDGVAAKLVDVVETLAAIHNLRVVITTDHGRLLSNAIRTLPTPANMQSHGRAAWGNADLQFPEDGYVVEEEVAYLHHATFALPTDAAVVIGEQAFYTADGRTGSEIHAHGGLTPEEVMIPWFVALRDFQAPELEVQIDGQGRAEATGQLNITVTNIGAVAVTCTSVVLHFANGRVQTLQLQLPCGPSDHVMHTVEMAGWPTIASTHDVTATVTVELPNGQAYTLDAAQVALTSEEMYTRSDILEGLDL